MAGTESGGRAVVRSFIAKYGSYEAFCEHMRAIAATGGKNGHTGGFAANRQLARRVGAIGGRKSTKAK